MNKYLRYENFSLNNFNFIFLSFGGESGDIQVLLKNVPISGRNIGDEESIFNFYETSYFIKFLRIMIILS